MDERDTLEDTRADFPALERRRGGKAPVYLDNACTTLVPRPVIAAMNEYYTDYPSCGGRRSHHWFAEEVTSRVEGRAALGIEGARHKIAGFIHARSEKEILFTLNTTQAVNTVALGLKFRPGDAVLISDREHNSNLLPWLRLQQMGLTRVEHLPADAQDGFDLDAFARRLKESPVRLVSLAWTSNVTGYTLPAREIIAVAHRHGARVLLDGAQTVPHQPVDVTALDVDFLAFSLHKMCGPRGVGVLYAKSELLGRGAQPWQAGEDVIEPVILGGGTVEDSTYTTYRLLEAPERFEAGIPNYPGLIAAGAAVDYLQRIGLERIAAREERLNCYLTQALRARFGGAAWLQILGPTDTARRGGILSFVVRRPNAVGIASELDEKSNIMIRDGVFCAHSYFNERFGLDWMHPKSHRDHRMIYRVSLYFYNTLAECDLLVDTLEEIFLERGYIE